MYDTTHFLFFFFFWLNVIYINKLIFFYSGCMVAAILKRPRTPPTNNPSMDYQTADSEHVLKRSRPFGLSDEVVPFDVSLYELIIDIICEGLSSMINV